MTTEDMMSFYGCSDFAFNFNLIVKLKMDKDRKAILDRRAKGRAEALGKDKGK